MSASSANIIWNSIQQRNTNAIGSNSVEATQGLERGLKVATLTVKDLQERMDKLILVCKAQFELLQAVTNITDQHLSEKILEIDLRDGKADSKVTPTQNICPDCGAGICAKFNRCLFCGYIHKSGDVFTTV